MEYHEQIDELVEQADALPHGSAKIELLQQAVRIADLNEDLTKGFECRLELIGAAIFGEQDDVAIVAFAWCRDRIREDPDRFRHFGYSYLWRYKWIINRADDDTRLTRAQLEGLLDDMEDGCRQFGYSLRPVVRLRIQIADSLGDFEQAQRHYEEWKALPSSSLDDCDACECNWRAEQAIAHNEYEKAIEIAQPIIDGELRCENIPIYTFGALMAPLIMLERFELADQLATRAYRRAKGKPQYTMTVTRLIYLRVRQRRWRLAVNMFDVQAPLVAEASNDTIKLEFWVVATALMKGLLDEGRKVRKFHIPETWDCHRPDGRYDLQTLYAWFDQRSDELVQKFDERSGTQRMAGKKKDWLALALGPESVNS